MCILFWRAASDGQYKFILAGNRDESLARPTAPLHQWPERTPTILSGRDLEAGGTWLGISPTNSRLAFLSNIVESLPASSTELHSRGELVTDFLSTNRGMEEWVQGVEVDKYAGFNLVVGELSGGVFWYVGNRCTGERRWRLEEGQVWGMSNAVFEKGAEVAEGWKKIVEGKRRFSDTLEMWDKSKPAELTDRLFQLLGDPEPLGTADVAVASDDFRRFIRVPPTVRHGDAYASRTGAVILVDTEGWVTFTERDWIKGVEGEDVVFRFRLGEWDA